MQRGMLVGCGVAALLAVLVCGGIIALVVTGVVGVFAATQPVADGATDFLALLGQGKTSEAYAATGSALSAQYDEPSFTAAVKQLGLTDYVSSSWNSRHISNNSGSVEGTVTTKSGSSPAKVDLAYEQGRWRVVGLRYAGRDLAEAMNRQVPPEEEVRKLATKTLTDADRAVRAGDFTAFYDTIHDTWKQETSPQRLLDTFKQFVDKKIIVAPAEGTALPFDAPASIDAEGMLVVGGRYQNPAGLKVTYRLEYLRCGDGWKLAAIKLDT